MHLLVIRVHSKPSDAIDLRVELVERCRNGPRTAVAGQVSKAESLEGMTFGSCETQEQY